MSGEPQVLDVAFVRFSDATEETVDITVRGSEGPIRMYGLHPKKASSAQAIACFPSSWGKPKIDWLMRVDFEIEGHGPGIAFYTPDQVQKPATSLCEDS